MCEYDTPLLLLLLALLLRSLDAAGEEEMQPVRDNITSWLGQQRINEQRYTLLSLVALS